MIELHIKDGKPCIIEYTNAKGEDRVLACFVRKTSAFGGLKSQLEFGSMVFDLGTTAKQAEEALEADKDYSDVLKFVDRDEEGFYRAVLK